MVDYTFVYKRTFILKARVRQLCFRVFLCKAFDDFSCGLRGVFEISASPKVRFQSLNTDSTSLCCTNLQILNSMDESRVFGSMLVLLVCVAFSAAVKAPTTTEPTTTAKPTTPPPVHKRMFSPVCVFLFILNLYFAV